MPNNFECIELPRQTLSPLEFILYNVREKILICFREKVNVPYFASSFSSECPRTTNTKRAIDTSNSSCFVALRREFTFEFDFFIFAQRTETFHLYDVLQQSNLKITYLHNDSINYRRKTLNSKFGALTRLLKNGKRIFTTRKHYENRENILRFGASTHTEVVQWAHLWVRVNKYGEEGIFPQQSVIQQCITFSRVNLTFGVDEFLFHTSLQILRRGSILFLYSLEIRLIHMSHSNPSFSVLVAISQGHDFTDDTISLRFTYSFPGYLPRCRNKNKNKTERRCLELVGFYKSIKIIIIIKITRRLKNFWLSHEGRPTVCSEIVPFTAVSPQTAIRTELAVKLCQAAFSWHNFGDFVQKGSTLSDILTKINPKHMCAGLLYNVWRRKMHFLTGQTQAT